MVLEPGEPRPAATGADRQRAFFAGAWQAVRLLQRAEPGRRPFAGPALVLEAHSSTVVESGWAVLDRAGALVLSRTGATSVPG